MTQELNIKQGKTYRLVIRAESNPIIRKPITGVTFDSGAPRLTVVGHGLKNGWRGYVTRVKGPTQLNAVNNPARPADFKVITVIDPNTVEFNEVTPVNEQGVEWPAYQSGGFLEFYTPVDLAGKTARMKVRERANKTSKLLASSEAGDAPLNVLQLTVDATEHTVTLVIPDTAADDFEWTTGYFDIELVGTDVDELESGKIVVGKEVTA